MKRTRRSKERGNWRIVLYAHRLERLRVASSDLLLMRLGVLLQMLLFLESLVARIARVCALTRVHLHVLLQIRGLGKRQRARRTHVIFYALVQLQVHAEVA